MKMTKKQKKLYRNLGGLTAILLSFLALTPAWTVTADLPSKSVDECCDLAAHDLPAPSAPAAEEPAAPAPQQLAQAEPGRVNDVYYGDTTVDGEPSYFADPNLPTFADNQPAPGSDLAEHDETYEGYRWSSAELFLARALPGTKADSEQEENPSDNPKTGLDPEEENGGNPDNPGEPTDPNNPNNPTNPNNPNNPQPPVATVPEPPAIALLAIGVLGVVVLRRRAR